MESDLDLRFSIDIVDDPIRGRYKKMNYISYNEEAVLSLLDNWLKDEPNNSTFENVESRSYHLYPNPATQILYVKAIQAGEAGAKYKMMNQLGQMVNEGVLDFSLSAVSTIIGIADLMPGIYYLAIISNHKNETYSFIKI